ncbi:MAG: 50S ribosomal protein L9 [Kiritimatiellia bacterium]
MATELLLLCDVNHLGEAGEVVKVADGYARNYLIPKDLAAPVTEGAKRRLEKLRKDREELAKIKKAEAQTKASKLNGLTLTVKAKTVDGKRLYGSISQNEVFALIEKEAEINLDRSQLEMEDHIKTTGEYELTVKLHKEVSAKIKLIVAEET